ncbi:MAG: immunoglobulin-like domain-containing protein [Thalassotalea sp.]
MKIMSFTDFKVKNIAKAICLSLVVSTLTACDSGDSPADTTGPVLTLTGDATVNLDIGVTYVEQGATATDEVDGPVSVTPTGHDQVDSTVPGTYTVTFNAMDAAGNAAESITRTVIVSDMTAPEITLEGFATVSVNLGDAYVDDGVTITDNYDTGLTATTVNPVDVDTEGSYTITYNVSDAAGNAATEVTRQVDVVFEVPDTDPVVTLVGESTITHLVGRPYREFGATTFDAEDGDQIPEATITLDPAFDVNTAGTYTVTYSVTDADANTTDEVRTVVIVEAADARPFKFTIDTAITGTSPSTDFFLSTADAALTYDFTVDWGDSTIQSNVTDPAITHSYATAGTYTISITGDFHHFLTTDIAKVVSIQQWGDIKWSSFRGSLENSAVLTDFPTDIPDFTAFVGTNSLQNAFKNSLFNHDVSLWDLGNSTNLLSMFHNATEFNQDLSKWDVSLITNFKWMFNGATNFNQDLSNWDFTSYASGVGTFNNSGISVANWDALLISLEAQATAKAITDKKFQGSGLFHSSAATNAITVLEAAGWTVTDSGLAP